MDNQRDHTIPRRTFLRGAAGLVGASALSLTPAGALAAFAPPEALVLSVVFWDGERFVPASSVTPDSAILAVDLQMQGFGETTSIRSIDCNPLVVGANGPEPATVYAWMAPPYGTGRSRLRMPVDPTQGLTLTVTSNGKSTPAAVRFVTSGSGVEPKLREGVYVIAAAKVAWSALELDETNEGSPVRYRAGEGEPAGFQYVLVKFLLP
jgi:hypothetical protein